MFPCFIVFLCFCFEGNVVWLDPHSAARALYNMSQPQCLPAQIPQPPPPQPAPPLEREQQEPEPMEQEEGAKVGI